MTTLRVYASFCIAVTLKYTSCLPLTSWKVSYPKYRIADGACIHHVVKHLGKLNKGCCLDGVTRFLQNIFTFKVEKIGVNKVFFP